MTVTLTDEEGRTASAEFHFQESELFRCVVTETAPMGRARVGHTATQLASGKVLVVGGMSEYTTTRTPNSTRVTPTTCEASAELFEPSTGTWTSTGALNHPRASHRAHLLPSGKVLVVGGGSCSGVGDSYQWKESITVELYEPSTGTWTVASEKSEGEPAGLADEGIEDGSAWVRVSGRRVFSGTTAPASPFSAWMRLKPGFRSVFSGCSVVT